VCVCVLRGSTSVKRKGQSKDAGMRFFHTTSIPQVCQRWGKSTTLNNIYFDLECVL
jgi:hypothetical protein